MDDKSSGPSGMKSGSRGLHSGGNPLDPNAVTTPRVKSSSRETMAWRTFAGGGVELYLA